MSKAICAAIASIALFCVSMESALAESSQDILQTMEHVADWELAHPGNASVPTSSPQAANPLGWIVGTFYTGLTALADRSTNPRYGDAIVSLGERQGWKLGPRPFHADDYEVAQNWIWAYGRKHDPRMIADIRQRFDAIVAANVPDSLMMVPASGSQGGCFRRWCWCDALFMGPPGWVALSQATHDPRYLTYADKEYRATTALLLDGDQALYYRDSSYFGKVGAQGEKIFWSRGNGWVYAGLARILTALPANSPSRAYYQALFVKMSHRVVALQKANGSWRRPLLDPRANPPPETSGTGFFYLWPGLGRSRGTFERSELPACGRAGLVASDQGSPAGRQAGLGSAGGQPARCGRSGRYPAVRRGCVLAGGRGDARLGQWTLMTASVRSQMSAYTG